MDLKNIVQQGNEIKRELFKKFTVVKEGHPGSILSIFDIVNIMYLGDYIKIGNNSAENDYFIMSKGHAASIQYPYLVRAGLIQKKDWDCWPSEESCLKVFANRNIPGIDVTGGSLGHGLGIAAGMALASKNDEENQKNVFTIISEGELYEGSIWEALLFISHHKLSKIKIILDVNDNIILGDPEKCLSFGDIAAKFQSFGFSTKEIDGHDPQQIVDGLDFLMASENGSLSVLIANTVKGKGISFFEGKPESHYWANLDDDMMKKMMEELEQ